MGKVFAERAQRFADNWIGQGITKKTTKIAIVLILNWIRGENDQAKYG